jgi:putative spermidine/putrescine transport system permease protein
MITRPRYSLPIVSATIATLLLAIGPVLILAVWSFARGWYWPALFPREWSMHAWTYVFSDGSGTFSALGNSFLIAFGVAIVSVAIAIPAGRVLALEEFPGKRAVLFLLLLPILAPPLAAAMGIHSLFLSYGLADSATGIVLIHLVQAVPYATLMLTGSFSRLDLNWEAQARTLGAGAFATWRYVTLPAIGPGLAVAASFAFLISWSQYLLTLLIGGGRVITLPMLLVSFERGGDEAIASALSLVYMLPVVLVFISGSRLFTGEDAR